MSLYMIPKIHLMKPELRNAYIRPSLGKPVSNCIENMEKNNGSQGIRHNHLMQNQFVQTSGNGINMS